VMNTQEH